MNVIKKFFIVSPTESVKEAIVNVFPIGCITKKQDSKELCEIGKLVNSGIVAISDDGKPVMDSFIMSKALEYSKMFNITVISHCEDLKLVNNGVINEGKISFKLGLPGIPNSAEEVMIARDIILAEHTGGHLHIAHVSTKGSVNLIREAKKRKINITCETAPHYFILTEDDIVDYNTNYKMNPPLRKKEDCDAIIEGLIDGTIDCIASDHAPHSREEKNVEFNNAPFGIIGLETEFPLSYNKLVIENKMNIKSFIQKMTINPSKIIRINKRGNLIAGNFADIIIFDPNKKFVVKDNIYSKSKNTSFWTLELPGNVITTIVNGKIVFLDEKFLV